MLPYDGMIRTGSEGVSHSVMAETPSEGRKVLERRRKGKQTQAGGREMVRRIRCMQMFQ
jgi:hypothetical protein